MRTNLLIACSLLAFACDAAPAPNGAGGGNDPDPAQSDTVARADTGECDAAPLLHYEAADIDCDTSYWLGARDVDVYASGLIVFVAPSSDGGGDTEWSVSGACSVQAL